MHFFVIALLLVVLSALFGYVNLPVLKLPNTIGLMITTLLFMLGLFLTSYVDPLLL